jgi:hypothetical protein
MLIGLSKKFIFIANLKAASSAIEQALKPSAEIAFIEAQSDKHIPFLEIERRFGWIFDTVPREKFMIFGVMRDPVDFVISLYNSHTHISFRIVFPHLYTGGMSFERFLDKWCIENSGELVPQYTRFVDENGAIGANFIIGYDRLLDGLRYIAASIGAPQLLTLPKVNVSNRRVRRCDLTHRQLTRISERFAEDERFLAGFCNRLLTRADQEAWQRPPAVQFHSPQPDLDQSAE